MADAISNAKQGKTTIAATPKQVALLMRAGYTKEELSGLTKYTASKLIDVTLANGGRKLEPDQVDALRNKTAHRNRSTAVRDPELFGSSQITINEDELHGVVVGEELRRLAEADKTNAVAKAKELHWYRAHVRHGRWEEFCAAIGLSRSSADKLARVGQTLTETPPELMEELRSRGFDPMHHRDQWAFAASREKYEELIESVGGGGTSAVGEANFAAVEKSDAVTSAESTTSHSEDRDSACWAGQIVLKEHLSPPSTAKRAVMEAVAGKRKPCSKAHTPEASRKLAVHQVLEQEYRGADLCEDLMELEIMEAVNKFLEEESARRWAVAEAVRAGKRPLNW